MCSRNFNSSSVCLSPSFRWVKYLTHIFFLHFIQWVWTCFTSRMFHPTTGKWWRDSELFVCAQHKNTSDIELNTNFQFSTINWLFKQSNTEPTEKKIFFLYKSDSFVDSTCCGWNLKFVARLQKKRRRRRIRSVEDDDDHVCDGNFIIKKFICTFHSTSHHICSREMLMKLQFSSEWRILSFRRKIKDNNARAPASETQCLRDFCLIWELLL